MVNPNGTFSPAVSQHIRNIETSPIATFYSLAPDVTAEQRQQAVAEIAAQYSGVRISQIGNEVAVFLALLP